MLRVTTEVAGNTQCTSNTSGINKTKMKKKSLEPFNPKEICRYTRLETNFTSSVLFQGVDYDINLGYSTSDSINTIGNSGALFYQIIVQVCAT